MAQCEALDDLVQEVTQAAPKENSLTSLFEKCSSSPKENPITLPNEKCSSSPNKKSKSPEQEKCAICLGELENKAFTDSCLHTFCFTCLQEWSKVRPQCPLCNQNFKSIIHNIQSDEIYDEYKISTHCPQDEIFTSLLSSLNSVRRFRYQTISTQERFRSPLYNDLVLSNDVIFDHIFTSGPQYLGSEYRRYIYNANMWVKPLPSGRTREASPTFYRNNPACTHRLLPWLKRELSALCSDPRLVTSKIELLNCLLKRFHILSDPFKDYVRFLGENAEHFIHEFYNFACSVHDMPSYDRAIEYDHRDRQRQAYYFSSGIVLNRHIQMRSSSEIDTITISSTSDSESSDSSNFKSKVSEQSQKVSQSPRSAQDEKDQASSSSTIDDCKDSYSSLGTSTFESSADDFQRPGPSGIQNDSVFKINPWYSDSSDEEQPVKVETLPCSSAKLQLKEDDSDSDCVIVECLKPIPERTPEVIEVDSEDENTAPDTERSDNVQNFNMLSAFAVPNSNSASSSPICFGLKRKKSLYKLKKHSKKKKKNKKKKHSRKEECYELNEINDVLEC